MKQNPGTSPPIHTAADALEPCGPTIGDHMTVDQANDLLAANPDVPHLLVVDASGRCEGVVTRAGLAAFLGRTWYSGRTPLRNTHHQRGPFAWPALALTLAAVSMRVRGHNVWPVTDDDGQLLGVLNARTVEDTLRPCPSEPLAATSDASCPR